MKTLFAHCVLASMMFSSCTEDLFRKKEYHERTVETLRIARKIDKLIRRKYRLKMIAEGTLSQLEVDKTRGSDYSFISCDYLDTDQARELVVKVVLEILKIHNEDQDIRKYLYEYPFNIKNVEITIHTKVGPRLEKVLPIIFMAHLIRKHLSIDYHVKSPELERLNENEYFKCCNNYKETFRTAIHKIQYNLPPDLLKVAQELDLLNGNLEDDYINSSIESHNEKTTKKALIQAYKQDYESGELTEKRYKELVAKTECDMKGVSRDEKIEKYKELFRNDFITEKRMRKLIELEENTEPYIQED